MKRTLLGWAIVLVVAAGCSGGGSSPSPGKDAPEGQTSASGESKPVSAPFQVGMVFDSGGRGDKSFNDSAYRGLERAVNEFKGLVEPKTVDSKQTSDYEKNLEVLAQAKVPLIIAVGISMKEAVDKVAPEYPDIKFALVDDVSSAPNVRGLKFKEEEGSFLAGAVAALMSKSGKIGFVGGMEIPLIEKFEAGYFAGAKTARPDIQFLPGKFTASWTDASLGKQCAKTLYSQGADVVFHASGACGIGVFEAAKEDKKFAIGVDSDQDDIVPGQVLTSMVKRVDEAVYQTIKDFKEGHFSPGAKTYDLKSRGVGLSEMKFTKDLIGEAKLAKIRQLEQDIISGKILVPDSMPAMKAYVMQMTPQRVLKTPQ